MELLELTTLAERRLRGDLIEVYKARSGISKINGVFKFGRSGLNLLSNLNTNDTGKFRSLKRNFINDRIKDYWNKLPIEVKTATSVNSFKSSLENFKRRCISLGNMEQGHYWEASTMILDKIEGSDYLSNKDSHNLYLKANPFVAKKKCINIS